jgi:outer membrane protein assembly factor BamD (BamD/ComL family)
MRIIDNNNNDDNNSTPTPSSWMGWKEKGRTEYERGNYEAAVNAYRTAITYNHCPAEERQIMLSNMVAGRLKIGGRAQAEAAVIAAKQVST